MGGGCCLQSESGVDRLLAHLIGNPHAVSVYYIYGTTYNPLLSRLSMTIACRAICHGRVDSVQRLRRPPPRPRLRRDPGILVLCHSRTEILGNYN